MGSSRRRTALSAPRTGAVLKRGTEPEPFIYICMLLPLRFSVTLLFCMYIMYIEATWSCVAVVCPGDSDGETLAVTWKQKLFSLAGEVAPVGAITFATSGGTDGTKCKISCRNVANPVLRANGRCATTAVTEVLRFDAPRSGGYSLLVVQVPVCVGGAQTVCR